MIRIPKIANVKINKLTVDGKNPNVLDINKQIVLKNNLKRFGFIIPIITNKDYVIADGEHRLIAATELGMSEVPVIALDVTEVDRRLLRQVLNKLRGEHDSKRDAEEYKWIFENDDAAAQKFLELLAQDDVEIDKIIESEFPVEIEEDDFDSEPPSDPTSKLGEIYKLGNHRLMCGDATNKRHVDELI